LNYRVVFLEDPRELNIPFDRGFALEVDHSRPKSASAALRFCLRSFPQIMIIGELLDPEISLTFIKGIEAGFSGTISTIHSDSAYVTIDRLATLGSEGSDFNREELLNMCKESIDMVIHVDFDYRKGKREVENILDFDKERKKARGIIKSDEDLINNHFKSEKTKFSS
jgi:Flp pilus assembly CpaF family ATPase